MSVIFDPSPTERQIIKSMRDELRRRLDEGEFDVGQVAERLGLVPEGVDTLIRRRWTFEEAYRVAEALDFDFAGAIQVGRNGNGNGRLSSNGSSPAD